jgi:predicted adenine nucleotide alpha hydrolase (AANH) superfamily ATPase
MEVRRYMEKVNYQRVLDGILLKISNESVRPKLLLHACCAPCSSYVLEYLSEYFDITLYFFNPNIYPAEEYDFRAKELAELLGKMSLEDKVSVVIETYNSDVFYNAVKGNEGDIEGGARCKICYRLRLEASAEYAAKGGFDYFTTTLSISPYKNSAWLNEIGEELASIYGVPYLTSDFKKKNGYKRSCELSAEYGLYRQNYCGCEFSRRQAEARRD